MISTKTEPQPNCIIRKRNGEIIFFEDMPFYEKEGGVYGYTVATPDGGVYFFSISYDGDFERVNFDTVTQDYEFEYREIF